MLTNLKIGARLALAFGIVLALLATLSIIALARTSAMRNDMNAVLPRGSGYDDTPRPQRTPPWQAVHLCPSR